MLKYNFKTDYDRFCHPAILENLMKDNKVQFDSYGEDEQGESTKRKIRDLLNYENCDLHFIPSGTITNIILSASVLRPHQGIIASTEGHITTFETGAVESTGHKILALETEDGKLRAEQVSEMLDLHNNARLKEHIVQPGMVYITNPTETGTIYKKSEIEDIYKVCKKNNVPLYIDGARMAMALTARNNDIHLSDYCNLCDIFYIGGTKCGALFGECLVIVNDLYKKDFRYIRKQRGGLFAKSFVLSSQFNTLFTNDLYLEIGKYSNYLAEKIMKGIEGKIDLCQEQVTNVLFPILSYKKIEKLREKYDFYLWNPIDENHSAIRLLVSWGTDEDVVDQLIADMLT